MAELPVGSQRCVSVVGVHILLCHTETGIYALENKCPHVGMPLQGGVITNDVLRCPAHGATFDVATGNPTRARTLTAVITFPVKLYDERIHVEVSKA